MPSSTFHGRDLFAPAAARITTEEAASDLGDPLPPSSLVRLALEPPARGRDVCRGSVAHVDRFGNLITDIPGSWVTPSALVEIGGVEISGVRAGYSAVEPGRLLVVVGSAGTLEISVRDGDASQRLSVGRGAPVSLRPERD